MSEKMRHLYIASNVTVGVSFVLSLLLHFLGYSTLALWCRRRMRSGDGGGPCVAGSAVCQKVKRKNQKAPARCRSFLWS